MKLPRWLVIAMLTTSVLSVLAAAGWWWVTWPERTITSFIQAADAHDYGDMKRLSGSLIGTLLEEVTPEENPSDPAEPRVKAPVARSFMDFLLGRQDFDFNDPDTTFTQRIRVERGRVVDCLIEVPEKNWKSIFRLNQ